jgi:hypothetical protein
MDQRYSQKRAMLGDWVLVLTREEGLPEPEPGREGRRDAFPVKEKSGQTRLVGSSQRAGEKQNPIVVNNLNRKAMATACQPSKRILAGRCCSAAFTLNSRTTLTHSPTHPLISFKRFIE